MKIRYATDVGCVFGQFVVTAENDQERAILAAFYNPFTALDKWRFSMHGFSRDGFNFGWQKNKDRSPENICRAVECPLTPKPRMLFLDDRAKRVESARRQFGEKWDLVIVSNVKECLRKLSEEDWDEVHLDHDLNGEDFQDPDEPTAGMEVVRYLEKCGGWPGGKRKPLFVIHSSNVFAACPMVNRLNAMELFARWDRFQYEEEK